MVAFLSFLAVIEGTIFLEGLLETFPQSSTGTLLYKQLFSVNVMKVSLLTEETKLNEKKKKVKSSCCHCTNSLKTLAVPIRIMYFLRFLRQLKYLKAELPSRTLRRPLLLAEEVISSCYVEKLLRDNIFLSALKEWLTKKFTFLLINLHVRDSHDIKNVHWSEEQFLLLLFLHASIQHGEVILSI